MSRLVISPPRSSGLVVNRDPTTVRAAAGARSRHVDLMCVAIMLLMSAAIPLWAASAQANPRSDMSAVDAAARSFWSALDATWNARDADRFSRLLTEEASFRFTDSGVSLEGRATILEFFAKQFSRQAAELRHVTHIREIRVVAAHVIAVDAQIDIVKAPPDGTPGVVRRFAAFALMEESSGAWKLRLLRVHQLPPAVPQAVRQQ